jgi:hypothetical protein
MLYMKGWPVGICSRCSATIHNAPYVSEHEDGQFARSNAELESNQGGKGNGWSLSALADRLSIERNLFHHTPPRRYISGFSPASKLVNALSELT